MPFVLREATVDDAQGIADVQVTSWRWAYKGLLSDEFLDSRDVGELADLWRGRLPYMANKCMWVAEKDSRIVGITLAGPARFDDRMTNGEIWTFYTHPDAARAGIGAALWRQAHDWLKAQGHDGFYVMVMRDNTIGRNFYRKMGGTENPRAFTVEFGGEIIPDTSFYWKF